MNIGFILSLSAYVFYVVGVMATPTAALAIDVEIVQIKKQGRIRDRAARVSIVNERGEVVYNCYIKLGKRVRVTDYRTDISGITAAHLASGEPFPEVRETVRMLIKSRILVGHAMEKDLQLLDLHHLWFRKRDTACYFQTCRGKTPSLKKLAAEHLNMSIQNGAHDSVEDARAAMRLYKEYEQEWNETIQSDFGDL